MTFDDDRLEDDIAALLRDETADTSLPEEHVARAKKKLALRLGIGVAGAASTAGIRRTPNDTASPVETMAVAGAKGVSRKLLGIVATTTFACGIATGWGVSRAIEHTPASPPSVSSVPTQAAIDAPEAQAVPAIIMTNPLPAVVDPEPTAKTATGTTSPPSRAPVAIDTSKDERALLDQARRALNEGDDERALALVDTHAKTFPRGVLGEERDVLRIQALAAKGEIDAARAAATTFRQKYPASPFLPAIASRLREP